MFPVRDNPLDISEGTALSLLNVEYFPSIHYIIFLCSLLPKINLNETVFILSSLFSGIDIYMDILLGRILLRWVGGVKHVASGLHYSSMYDLLSGVLCRFRASCFIL